MPVYGNITDALARLPDGAQLKLMEQTGGRPTPYPKPDGTDVWTKEELAGANLPKGVYQFKCLNPELKSKRISLDLSYDSTEISTGNMGSGGQVIQTTDTSLVVDSLIRSHSQDRTEIISLRNENQELRDEVTELRVEIAELRATLKYKEKDDSVGGIFERSLANFLQGPGGSMMGAMVMEKMGAGKLTGGNGNGQG